MPLTLLPASAQAFAPRAAPTIVLNTRVETWLTQTLKRVNRVRRPLNSTTQHYRCLTETLSGPNAIWTLASLMVPKAPDADLRKDPNSLVEAIFNYQLLHVEAYVVHVDMVSQHEIAFKLTQDSIDALIEYHTDVYSVDTAASTWDWSDKDQQLKKLQADFKQAINRFVYRTHVRALEGLEDEGAGELLEGRSEEVKSAITGLFLPLLPPPPRMVEAIYPQAAPQQYAQQAQWWQQQAHLPSPPQHMAPPAEPWRVLGSSPIGSSPSPTTSLADSSTSSWSPSARHEAHIPSPSPAYSQPQYTSAPQSYNTSGPYYTTSASSMAPLPLPSAIAQQCGPNAMGYGGGMAWAYNDFMPQQPFPIQI
ncbi:hypothetical protein FH972_022621 [Carpinus fangiana]|uniref:Uncharacterized protein n=1 Tax=Carpinus fangiana TaxID=176857 RepID=A0A5N6KSS1_9ROSI|nr:hypothetical protein FH972_022621 [Carpinus fangiana]